MSRRDVAGAAWRAAWAVGAPAALALARVAARFDPKLREGLEGRRGWRERWRAARGALGERPVWFHVASVGEFEQARPIVTALAEAHPDVGVALTFASPSGVRFAQRRERIGPGETIRFADYLPPDTRGAMREAIDILRPRLVVFVKFDLWPHLVWCAREARVPRVLVDATLSPSSGRLRWPARSFYRHVYEALDRIVAIGPDDAARFAACAPGHPGISVAGDTRFDRVWERWRARESVRLDWDPGEGPVVILGSTWPPDEARVLPALGRLLGERPELRAVVAPHEPEPGRVAELERWALDVAGSVCRATGEGPRDARVLVIDTVGVLAEAYRLGDVVYVGGSFSTGVHSVIEPAIAGVPVLFGPVHDNALEALELVARGAGFAVRDAASAERTLRTLLDDPSARRRAGEAAEAYVRSQLGATAKCLAQIEPFL